MTGNDIKVSAEVYSGKKIDRNVALIYINEATSKLGDMGLIYGTVTINDANPKEWYYMPGDTTHIFSVEDEDGKIRDAWQSRGNAIRFNESGNFTVQARKLPKSIKSLDETPDCPAAYHQVIVTYLRQITMLSDDPQYATRLRMDKFEQEAMRVYQVLRRKRVPKQIRVIRHA